MLAPFASFKNLCYGSTAIITILLAEKITVLITSIAVFSFYVQKIKLNLFYMYTILRTRYPNRYLVRTR